ncbi:InlB B-repeat-containing protein [Candidatus Saccharibacteria bacterium]|nr:InlB B-repeat-containing protein [Candidatus Saccharibacteria bacterium]
MKFKPGDTLIEVALAIGIFSMVAIAVVSVMSGSMSSAQSALELTLTREEIDAQAEALRFIQTSYIASGDTNLSNNTKYAKLWHAIADRAKEPTAEILEFHPDNCAKLYSPGNLEKQGAFVINTRGLGYNIGNELYNDYIIIDDVILKPGRTNWIFSAAATFPRLVFKNEVSGEFTDDNNLLDRDVTNKPTAVEGIYVVPVRDNYTTTIVDGGEVDDAVSAYYDFYIRTCWYATGATRPSTISTVIRLYNPDAIVTDDFKDSITLSFNGNDSESSIKASNIPSPVELDAGAELEMTEDYFATERVGFDFVGWSTRRNSTPEEVEAGLADGAAGFYDLTHNVFVAPTKSRSGRVTLYAIWRAKPFNIRFRFNKNGGTGSKEDQVIENVTVGSTVTIDSNNGAFTKEGAYFSGWEDRRHNIYNTASAYAYTITEYGEEKIGEDGEPYVELLVNLKAVWKDPYTRINYVGTTIDPQECSSARGCYITTQTPSEIGLIFMNWCTNEVTNYVTCTGKTYQPGDYYPAISRDVNLYPTWKLEEFWVDANIYVNCEKLQSGKAGFNIKTYIDGQEVDKARHDEVFNGAKIRLTDIDFYQPVEFSRLVRIEFYDVEGYHIVNEDTICGRMPEKSYCSAHREDGMLVVELTVYNIPDGATLNSTNQYAIDVEPYWVSDEPMELAEGVEACSHLEWEPIRPEPEPEPEPEPDSD